MSCFLYFFFFSSRRRHTRLQGDWSSDVCSSDLPGVRNRVLGASRQDDQIGAQSRPDGAELVLATEGARGVGRRDPRSEERRVGREGRAGGVTAEGTETER